MLAGQGSKCKSFAFKCLPQSTRRTGPKFLRRGQRVGGIIGAPESPVPAARPFRQLPVPPIMTTAPEEPAEAPIDVQRILMDRARRQAERHVLRPERPLAPRLVGLALALVVVVVVLFAFDRFLASMQRFLGLPVVDPEPDVTEPLPAYVVPAEPSAPAPTGQADANAGR